MFHLRNGSVSVVVDDHHGTPFIRYWGAALPEQTDFDALVLALERGRPHGTIEHEAPLTVLPEHALGYPGLPAIRGHRADGSAWAPRFTTVRSTHSGTECVVEGEDPAAGLKIRTQLVLGDALTLRACLTNTGPDTYWLDSVDLALPLPAQCREVLDLTGRWARELQPRRRSWLSGTLINENRRGRTSHDHLPLLFAGTAGFGEWAGEVWGVHLAWSGNSRLAAECLSDGRRCIRVGELLHPGEIALAPGAQYETPEVVAVCSASGLTAASWAFHRYARSLPAAPSRPRPVLVNTWEAVYFDHDVDRLCDLATAAASVGAERFVLDDGWFSSRRSDRAGLGDWWVSAEQYPNGLHPLIDHVESLGMEFGLWVEPEMVNPDSELYRSHPDWALAARGYEPVLGRHQLVLDLTNPDAWNYILGALDDLLRGHRIGFLKWDMNRDHVHASSGVGQAATHAQTIALYALLDELRARHPHVEIESCASGGGRIDLGILRRTERVWTSDCNDPLERQVIQRSASLLLPAELVGAHIGPSPAHTTGRRHTLSFRAGTALFGHLGLELDITSIDDVERARVSDAVALHKTLRPLLHHGDFVRFDHPDEALLVQGVYARDRSDALISFAQVGSPSSLFGEPVRLHGLPPDAMFDIRLVPVHRDHRVTGPAVSQPAWIDNGIVLSGAQLSAHGLQPPVLFPEQVILVRLCRLDR